MARQKNKNLIAINSDDLRTILYASLQLANVQEFAEANSLLDQTHNRFHESPIFHRVNAAVHLAQSESSDNPSLKESLRSALVSTALAPSNLELSVFLVEVHVLFSEKFVLGIQECVRALSVPNPVVLSDDERFEELNWEADASGVKTVAGRIEFCRRRLRFLKDMARAAIIDPSIVREYKKCMLLVRKWYQDWIHIDKKVIQESPKRVQVKSYLESLTAEDTRKYCVEIDVSELTEDSTFYKEAYHVLLEALAFAEGLFGRGVIGLLSTVYPCLMSGFLSLLDNEFGSSPKNLGKSPVSVSYQIERNLVLSPVAVRVAVLVTRAGCRCPRR